MTKSASLKQRLIAAVLVLVMLVGSLIGTTFAWFTDEVTSSGNKIISGSLKVDLELLDKATGNWSSLKETNKPIFDYDNWEPGYVDAKILRVENEGTLALKWKAQFVSEFELSKLAEVIDVYVKAYGVLADSTTVSYPADRTLEGYTKVGTVAEFVNTIEQTTYGNLLAGEVAYLGIALKMQENAGNEYQDLDLGGAFDIRIVATQMAYEGDSFGKDYDDKAEWPTFKGDYVASAAVELNDDNTVKNAVALQSAKGEVSATLPAGVLLENGTNKVTLSVSAMDNTGSNITVDENEKMSSVDVHVTGVAAGNTAPIIVTVKAMLASGLNMGNYKLYHVEDGATNQMIYVATAAELDAHNEFTYDPATGDVTMALCSFSEIAVVAEEAKWEGNRDYSWYNADATELTIANADQLAGFGAIVGGMDGQTRDSFAGKTVKLVANIKIGDTHEYYADASENGIIFYPIGYYNSTNGYTKSAGGSITSGFKTFQGTFDGNGHTVSDFYQNTWEMFGDYNDGYSGTPNHYRDGMGLFGKVYGGTVKNLTVKNFSSDGEFTTTGTIAAYADCGATFENIAIFNCNPRVYNIGNGGIVGCVGWYANDAHTTPVTFKNITVDNTNKISALWGSWDVACGGIVGQYYPTSGQENAIDNAGIYFENCHVSAVMDVYNDVCANYQYYAYRYTGMLIGSVRENETIDGHVYPKMDGITASGCTVHFGDWNDYYYCELVANSLASYTHDHQMSRLTQVASVDVANKTVTSLDGKTTAIPTSGRVNYVVVKAKDESGMWIHGDGHDYAECYHFVNGVQHFHDVADADNPNPTETVNGVEGVLKEDKQLIYREFNNLVTGYGWGVTSKGVDDVNGVEILDKTMDGSSVNKFTGKLNALTTDRVYNIDEIFAYIENCGVKVVDGAVNVTITNLDENGNVIATFTRGEKWNEGTISFENTGNIAITIQDYYFCNATTINATVTGRVAEEKFDVVMNNGDFLHRVGNSGTVALDKLFKAKDGVTVGTVSVTVAAVDGTGASGTYSNNAIQFNGTGVVKVTITDNDYCTPTVLTLEVVDAKNVTAAESATANNVVLLNDAGLSSLTVSGRYAFYGNGFTLTYTGNGQYLNNGLKQGVVTVSENGTLDNVRIVASIYPSAYMYYGSTNLGDYVQGGPSSVEGTKTRYHYQLSAVAASGNATISNCYIYGGRNNVFVNTGDVTIKDTVMECGVVANVQIQSNASHTITLENVTTIQYLVDSNVADTTSVKMLGAGIIVGPETTENPKIVLNGSFKQYNWVNADDKTAVSAKAAQLIIDGALNATEYNHTVNGKTASNLGIVYMNTDEANIENNTGLPYTKGTVEISGVSGTVYSLKNATESQIYSDYANADKSTENGLYQPQFKYDSTLGNQYVAEGGDEHCFREGDTIKVMFPSGDTKELDLAALVNIAKYSGQDLGLVITVKDSSGNDVTVTNGKITLSAIEEYTVTYTVIDTLFYDKDGNKVEDADPHSYSWDVTISVSLKDTAVPDAYFAFDTTKQKMGYYKPTFGNVIQYIPFLAGLKIYDYNGQTAYLRFDGDADFNKVASIEVTNKYSGNDALVVVKLTDGGVITLQLLARADSGGGSDYTGKIQTKNNIIYFVNNTGTSNKESTTTAAYWYVDYYKFTGNNGVAIQSAQQTFNSTGSSASTPSGSFSTTIKYTVTYDANEGNCGQATGYATSASEAVTLPTPTRSGYIFAGWYTAASGGTRVGGAGESYTPSADITLYAQWGKPCTVTYNANGGSCGTASEKYSGTALTLPTPTRDGYWFIGWYDAAEGGNKIGDAGTTYNPSGEITLYAHWQEKIEYTVNYNANGGTCGTESATYQGTALTLPTATKVGSKFLGWSDGTKTYVAGESYTPSANVTLTAQWEKIAYTITVSTSNATVSGVTNGQTAYYGDTITFTVSYSKNSNKTTTVTDGNGNPVTTTGSYTFTMPASDVTISASSKDSCVTGDTLVTLADGTQKRIDEVTFADKLLVWDFDKGVYTFANASIIENHGYDTNTVIELTFEDGTTIKVVNVHGFFDADLNKWVDIDAENAQSYIGHSFTQINGDTYKTVKLVSATVTTEYIEAWSILSADYYNCVLEGLFSITPPATEQLAFFEIGADMKYDAEAKQADIETYGLYTYEEFAHLLTEEQFEALNIAEIKVAVGKGLITYDEILWLIAAYA